MSFYDLPKIEKAQDYLDIAFKRASKLNTGKVRGDSVRKFADREINKMDVIRDVLDSRLDEIVKAFPGLDNLTEFYSELLKVTLDYDSLKKALGSVSWARKQVFSLHRGQRERIRKARSEESVMNLKRAFMGRVSSVMKQIDPQLKYLDEARKVFKTYPVIKQMPTVCISGFPNVGKSTLLAKITTSKPEVANYAFTTKKLNLGYMKVDGREVQLIDTPGTLARPEKMNAIEKQAYLAIKYQADLVVFVFDPTETYPLKDQEELLALVKKFRKPVILYLSKTDIASQEAIEDFSKKYEIISDVDALKKEILVNL